MQLAEIYEFLRVFTLMKYKVDGSITCQCEALKYNDAVPNWNCCSSMLLF